MVPVEAKQGRPGTNPWPVKFDGISVVHASSDNTPITTAAETVIIPAPVAGSFLRIYYLMASNSSATTTDASWRNGSLGPRVYRVTLPKGGVFAHNIKPAQWDLAKNAALYLSTSAAGSVHWTVEYAIIPG